MTVSHPDLCQTCHGLDTIEGGDDCPDTSWCPSSMARSFGRFTCGQPRGHEGKHRTGAVEWVYDAIQIRAELEPDRGWLEALLRVGQKPDWSCDQRTKDLWCLGKWIDAKLEGHERRVELGWYFNRTVRAEHDPFEVAAVVMNKFVSGEPLEDHYQRYFRQERGR